MTKPSVSTPSEAASQLAELRAEHQPIERAILADPGMRPATRDLLMAHLQEEEQEWQAEIERLSPGPEAGVPRLTVGSLRPADPFTGGGSVGSLRRG